MIRKIRQFIMENTPIMRWFNKLGGMDYIVYNKKDVIVGTKFIDYFVTTDGAKYKNNNYSSFMIESTRSEYDWSDIRPDDIVLDIGAHVGGFTISAALKAKHVYAVEPIFYKELEENVKLNNLSNVTILSFAVGDGSIVDLSFNKTTQIGVQTFSIINIIKLILLNSGGLHKISFLKCDCEGYEWFIWPSNLDGIRRIEMEIHPNIFPTKDYNPELIPYIKQNWNTHFTNENREAYILHAHKKN